MGGGGGGFGGGDGFGGGEGFGGGGFKGGKGGKGGGKGKRKWEPSQTEVFVVNLSFGATEQEVMEHMSSVGEVTRVKLLYNPDGRAKGAAIVEYATPDATSQALAQLQGSPLNEREVFVREFYS